MDPADLTDAELATLGRFLLEVSALEDYMKRQVVGFYAHPDRHAEFSKNFLRSDPDDAPYGNDTTVDIASSTGSPPSPEQLDDGFRSRTSPRATRPA